MIWPLASSHLAFHSNKVSRNVNALFPWSGSCTVTFICTAGETVRGSCQKQITSSTPIEPIQHTHTCTVPQNWHTQSHESHDHRAQKSITLSLTSNEGKPNQKTNQAIMVLKMIQDIKIPQNDYTVYYLPCKAFRVTNMILNPH